MMVLVTIKCPHCRAKQYIDTHWMTKQTNTIKCENCRRVFQAYLWDYVKPKEKIWSVS